MSIDNSQQAARRIADYIITELNYALPIDNQGASESLQLAGAIDSVGMLELATFLEDAFQVKIDDEEIRPENFATIGDVVRLLEEKGAVAQSGEAPREPDLT